MSREKFNTEECDQWEGDVEHNPRTKRKISVTAPFGVTSRLLKDCKQNFDWDADECVAFHKNDTINPKTKRTIKKDGVIYRALVAKCATLDIIHNNNNCSNDSDPITLDKFEDMDKADKKDLIKIGPEGAKHCLTLKSAYSIYEKAIHSNELAKDPYNPKHTFTDEEINLILSKMKKQTPEFTPPKYEKYQVPGDIKIDFWPDMMARFYKVVIIQVNASTSPQTQDTSLVFDLGWIPANIEPSQTGSTDISSAVVMAKISELWDNGKMFNSYIPGFMELAENIPLQKTQDYWITIRRGGMMWNMTRFKEFAMLLNDA